MKIEITNHFFFLKRKFLLTSMKAFILFFCTTAFSFTTGKVFTQNVKITVDKDKTVTIDEVFDLLRQQTDFVFIYQEDMFKDVPKVKLKKGTINANKLLNESLSDENFSYEIIGKNKIVITKIKTEVKVQQKKKVSGTITDANGAVLPGVNILVKGTTNGVQSDFDGKFAIDVDGPNSVLVISYIGFVNQEIVVGSQTNITVKLLEDYAKLEEVVVVGYGTQKKSDLTGSVAVVNVESAKKAVTYDVAKMLQGQAPGVSVQSSGEPGGFVNIKIRGVNSFSNNNPLFVIDGVIVDSPFDFAPGDIESMQVLKDASSAAIYGVRGANGVVIITTKKGKTGAMEIKYKSLYGVQNVAKEWSVTDRVGYQKITTAAEVNDGKSIAPGNDPTSPYYINNVNTNWQKEAYGTGTIQNHSLTFNGGAEFLGYNLNVDYFKNTSYLETPQDYERYSMNLNLHGKKGKFKYGSKIAYTESDKENFNSWVGESAIQALVTAIPTMPVYDDHWIGGYGGTYSDTQKAISLNVIGYNNLISNTGKRNHFIGDIWGELEIVKGLKYKLDVSYDKLHWFDRKYTPEFELGWYYRVPSDRATLNIATGNQTKTFVNNILTYNLSLGKHNIDALVGSIDERNEHYNHFSSGVGYDATDIKKLQFADNTNTNEYEYTITGKSYISRLNYGYDDRYLLTANFRQDKTSLFSQKYNSANFYSFSGAWKLSNEKFIHLPEVISNVKLRGGYGIIGNNTIPQYFFATTMNSFASYDFNDELAPGSTVVNALDPNVHWEETKTANVALEVGMFNNDLQFTAEYFHKKSNDLLIRVPLPFSSGAFPADVTTNAGAVENRGFEFSLIYNNNKNEFKYSIAANIGTLKNKVTQIGFSESGNPIPGLAAMTEVGRSIGEIYAYETDGIFQSQAEIDAAPSQTNVEVGDMKFKDQLTVDTDGDGVLDAADGVINDRDRVFQGVTIPKYNYGINLSASYKNWNATMFWQGSGGNKVFNGLYRDLMVGKYGNHHTDMLDYWTPTNTDTNVPRPTIEDGNGNSRDSNRFIESGNYIKLQTAEISYNIPLSKTSFIKNARVYANGQNLWIISKYRGYDPDFMSDGLFSRGYDGGSFPNPRTVSLGIEVSF
ncbi:TonB-linked outer membrane protein, SusC/RagA family [Flavobacterium daejeonense]|nr:TonB-linked outer membrane protein, SusC/RagA family [Flavobacterium daejeonense]